MKSATAILTAVALALGVNADTLTLNTPSGATGAIRCEVYQVCPPIAFVEHMLKGVNRLLGRVEPRPTLSTSTTVHRHTSLSWPTRWSPRRTNGP